MLTELQLVERVEQAIKEERERWSTAADDKRGYLQLAMRDGVLIETLPRQRSEAHMRYMDLKNRAVAEAAVRATFQ